MFYDKQLVHITSSLLQFPSNLAQNVRYEIMVVLQSAKREELSKLFSIYL